MDAELDQSTNRQWSEGRSPLCAVREIPMQNRNERDSYGVEIHGPGGVHVEQFPFKEQLPTGEAPWTMQHMTRVKALLEAAGYEQTGPTREGVLFAFAPKVHADEVRETPFDSPPATLCERLSMIACTRAGPMTQDGGQIRGRLYDYESGCPWEIRADRVQPDLQPVRSK